MAKSHAKTKQKCAYVWFYILSAWVSWLFLLLTKLSPLPQCVYAPLAHWNFSWRMQNKSQEKPSISYTPKSEYPLVLDCLYGLVIRCRKDSGSHEFKFPPTNPRIHQRKITLSIFIKMSLKPEDLTGCWYWSKI